MTYRLTDEHDELRAVVRELAEERIAPRAAEIDETAEFPWDLKELLAKQDLLGTCFEERHGGTNLDGIGQVDPGRGDRAGGCHHQPDPHRPEARRAADHAGRERRAEGPILPAARLRRVADRLRPDRGRGRAATWPPTACGRTRDGDHYVLNGSKRFITHGSIANVLTVFALTDPQAGGRKGMSAFIVETDTPGFAAPRVEHKMGIRGSPTAELTFDDVRVPVENRLGEEGDGFKIAMATLDRSRLGIAAQAVGIAQGALDEAVKYAADRQQFGQRVVDFQGIQFMLADMASQTEAARQLTYAAAAARVDAVAPDLPYWTSSAKLIAGRHRHAGHDRRGPDPGRIRLYQRVPRGADDA